MYAITAKQKQMTELATVSVKQPLYQAMA